MNCGARLGFCCYRQVIHDNGGQLPVDEVSSLMSFLVRLIADPVTPGRRQPFRSSAGSDSAVWVRHMDDDMEVQRLAYVAIGVIFSRAGPAISNTTWKSTVEVWFAIYAHEIYLLQFSQSWFWLQSFDLWWSHYSRVQYKLHCWSSEKFTQIEGHNVTLQTASLKWVAWVNSNPHASLTGPLSYVTKWPCNHTISMIVYAYIWIPNGSK